jgi:hypothetical protein
MTIPAGPASDFNFRRLVERLATAGRFAPAKVTIFILVLREF